MTPRERVYAALRFEDTDIVPYQVGFTVPAYRRWPSTTATPTSHSKIGNHLAGISHRQCSPWVEVEPGHLRDEWGVVWNRTIDKDIGVVENLVLPEPTLAGCEFPRCPRPACSSCTRSSSSRTATCSGSPASGSRSSSGRGRCAGWRTC